MLTCQRSASSYITRLACFWRIGAICSLVGTIVVAVALVFLALPPRSNHVAYDVRWLALPSVIAAMYGLLRWWTPGNRRLGLALCAAALAFTILVLFLDYYSLLMDYERWCERGMPSRWSH